MSVHHQRIHVFAAAFAVTLFLGACTPPEEAVERREPEKPVETMPSPQPAPGPTELERRERTAALAETASDAAAPGTFAAQRNFAVDPLAGLRRPDRPVDRENYAHFDDNPVKRVLEHPVSTFSIDVDTGSYANVRRMLREGRLPPADAVRVEEMINYFGYDYPAPEAGGTPFAVTVEQAVTPWNADTRLVQVGIQGWKPEPAEVPPANLVFLVDVSGSMASADKLGLLKNALKMLTRQLDGDDRIAVVVYAGATGVVLESTPGDRHAEIIAALDRLSAGGRTNGAAGIELAYSLAAQGFVEDGINRVILATDGDFNVGTVDFEALKDLAERKRQTGVAITTLGFGTGNYNDHLMEQLADAGNGNYAYIDTLNEARKVLVDELGATLQTIASDVKIQVEFNPAVVAEYRLIGYENRVLAREDFNNDAVDAGEIGAGHTVTALYEVALVDSDGQRVDPLRYQRRTVESPDADAAPELAFLRLRYKQPGESQSTLVERPIRKAPIADAEGRLAFAAAVAAFGQHLRGGKYLEGLDLDAVHELAARAKGDDPFGYRGEFLQLVRLAESLQAG
ncbi:MAG: von Willebrand factor type A domain-containing protein [Wenzhouxiangellaceae bacterium]|nr:von Willebrand factor type A domain-containing protein [Wenzhouxiangellaceae bacterium]